MAKRDFTPFIPPGEPKTYQNLLSDAIGLIMHPLKDFLALMDDETEGATGRIMRVIAELLERQDQELDKIYEAINRTLGKLSLEMPMHGEYVEFAGRTYQHPEIIRAVLESVKLQVVPKGGGE